LVFALLGTIGQSAGLVLSKYGMRDYDVFAATQIRIITGTIGFIILVSLIKRWPMVKQAASNGGAMKFIAIGVFLLALLLVFTFLF